MAIWLIRAGSHGEYEQKFIQENRVYVTWDGLDVNLGKLADRPELVAAMTQRYADAKAGRQDSELGQPDMAVCAWDEKRRFGGDAAQVAACYPDWRNYRRLPL